MSAPRDTNPAHGTPDDSGSIDSQGPLLLPEVTFVHEAPGDLFDAPDGTAIVHACNCEGAWGAGIAATFRENYPGAFEFYSRHCDFYYDSPESHSIIDLSQEGSGHHIEVGLPLGTALVIPPQSVDINIHGRRHWIVCLFASSGYGRRVNTQRRVLSNLHASLQDLSYQLQSLQVQAVQTGSDQPLALYANRFCTGLFRVRWELVRSLIGRVGLQINVCFPYTGDTPPGGRLPDRWQYQ